MTDNKELYKDLQESPLFQLSLASKELFHSNFLAWIGSWYQDNKGQRGIDHPFRFLMKALGANEDNVDNWPEGWYIAREYKNFDLCVLEHEPEDLDESNESCDLEKKDKTKHPLVLLVLENKVKSIPYLEQLHEYQDKILDINFDWIKSSIHALSYKWQLSVKEATNTKHKKEEDYAVKMKQLALQKVKNKTDFILLSMSTRFPEMGAIQAEKIWKIVDYLTYLNNLKTLLNTVTGLNHNILEDYCKQLESLLKLHDYWTDDTTFCDNQFLYFEKKLSQLQYRFDYLKLKELRIHDLFQKQRYAKMCSLLKEKIEQSIIKKYELQCVSRLDLTKDELEKKVNIGFNFLHGEPLLDIWLGTKEFVYTIQVQGDRYEHGIQKKLDSDKHKGVNSTKLWKLLWEGDKEKNENPIAQSVNGWNWICPFLNPFDEDGSIILKDKEGKEYFPIVTNTESIIFKDKSVFPKRPKKREKQWFPFLKYEIDTGVTFIYQYRIISDQATVKKVLDYIVADLSALCNNVFNNEKPF